jgi:hypothetical protein
MLVRSVALRCDACGALSSTRGFESTALARHHAQREGWVREVYSATEKHDICSRCKIKT